MIEWVIQENIFDEDSFQPMIDFMDKVGITYHLVKVVPFTHEITPMPVFQPDSKIVVLGSYFLSKEAKRLGWTPGAWFNENYDYRVWSEKWLGNCVNSISDIMPFGSVYYQPEPFFIRPCADDKLFTGKVIDWAEYLEWRIKVIEGKENYTDLNLDTPVLISLPRKITEEYRFLVVGGKVITGSLYKSNGVGLYQEVRDTESMAWVFAHLMCQQWTPAEAFVIDIAIVDGFPFVMEMGCVNSAGLYKCDVQKFVMAVEDMLEKES